MRRLILGLPFVWLISLPLVDCVGDTTPPTNDGSTQDATASDGSSESSSPPDAAPDAPSDAADAGLPPLTIKAGVAVGFGFACALRSSGKIYCWGSNDHGQFGNLLVSSTPTPTPAQVANITTAARIVAGLQFVCALLTDHTVSCWGDNGTGELGQSPTPNNPTPTVVSGIGGVVEIAAGGNHVCARKSDGSVWCWGANQSDQLGYDNATDAACINSVPCNHTPTQVAGLTADGIAAGNVHSCARIGSTVKCWGSNAYGEGGHVPGQSGDLGSGTSIHNPTPTQAVATGVGALFAGSGTTCMLDGTQKLSCWGNDSAGQLGDQGVAGQSSSPLAVANMPAALLAAGSFLSTCALSTSGRVYCWGSNGYGEQGNGTSNGTIYGAATPSVLTTKTMVAIAGNPVAGDWCAVANDDSVYCWGLNDKDELGHSNAADGTCSSIKCDPTPTTVAGLP